jgi:hypothetical protein
MLAMKAKFPLCIDGNYNYGAAAMSSNSEIRVLGRRFNDGRLGVELDTMTEAEIIALAEDEAMECLIDHNTSLRAHAWLDANEQDVQNAARRERYMLYSLHFVRACHALGLRTVVFNLGVGNPGSDSIMEEEDVRAVLAESDYVGYHCYGPPGTDLMMTDTSGDFSFRWRRYWDLYESKGWRMPPVMYTEATTYGGWHGNFSPEEIRDDLIGFGGEMLEDPWAIGLQIFAMGDYGLRDILGAWHAWDILPYYPQIINPLGTWNEAHPVDAVSGTRAQQWECTSGASRGGVVHTVNVPQAGSYLISARIKWEWYPLGQPDVSLLVGYDPTGQTSDGNAGSLVWDHELIEAWQMDTDIWYQYQWLVSLPAGTTSLWFGSSAPAGGPHYRISIDDVSVYASTAVLPTMTPSATPGVVCYPGDADGNLFVNAVDYSSVRDNFGQPSAGPGDADCSGFVNAMDYRSVRDHFGTSYQ